MGSTSTTTAKRTGRSTTSCGPTKCWTSTPPVGTYLAAPIGFDQERQLTRQFRQLEETARERLRSAAEAQPISGESVQDS